MAEFMRIFRKYSVPSNLIQVEILERSVMDRETLCEITEALHKEGFTVAMDDFGSGESSLNMLTTITVDAIKIDMKFIREMRKDDKSLRMIKLIVDIARFLNVPTVAEGVEDEVQVNILKKMGCDLIQGFYFGRPVPPDEFEKLIEAEN